MDWFLKYYPIIVGAWAAVSTLIMFVLHKTYAPRDEHVNLKSDVNNLKKAIQELPTLKEIHVLELKIERLSGDIKSIEPSLLSVKHLSDILLENELLRKKEK